MADQEAPRDTAWDNDDEAPLTQEQAETKAWRERRAERERIKELERNARAREQAKAEAAYDVNEAPDPDAIDHNAPLAPLHLINARYADKRPNPDQRAYNAICNRWIWITGIERFVNRLDPTVAWKAKQFDSEFNYLHPKGASISAYLFKLKNTLRRFQGPVFIPSAPEIVPPNYNLWRPSPIVPKANPEKLALWNEHLAFLFPDETARAIVLDWLAWVLQNPSQMPLEALLLTGKFGTGKSLIARVFEQIIGEHNTQRPKNSSLKGQFNTWMDKAKLVLVEELLQTGQKDIAHELKEVITEPTAEVNTKFIPAYKIASYIAMLALSNEANAFPIATRDRRWRVVESPVTHEQKDAAYARGYFKRIMPLCDTRKHPPTIDREFIAAVAWDLLQRKTPGVLNWTFGNAPTTAAKSTMIELGKSDLERWLDENGHEPPLSWGLVNVAGDLLDSGVIPERIMRKVPNVQGVIEKWLKDHMDGVAIGDHRVRVNTQDGTTHTRKLWAVGELGRRAKAGIEAGREPRHALHPVSPGATYNAARMEGVKPVRLDPVTAAEDFGREPEEG